MSLFVMCDNCGTTKSFKSGDDPGNWMSCNDTDDGKVEAHVCSRKCREGFDAKGVFVRVKAEKWPTV